MFSPFQAFNVGCSLEPFVEEAFSREGRQEKEEYDDAEGWPLSYAPFSSPLTSPDSSPLSSRSASPSTEHGESSTAPVFSTARPRSPGRKATTHKQAGYYKRRQKKRAAAKDLPTRKIRSSQSKRYQDIEVVKNSLSVRRLPVTRVGFIGKRLDVTAEHKSLETYLAEGFKVVKWDGRCSTLR